MVHNMKLYIIRHGERGHGDSHDELTENGYFQAKNIAEFLINKKIDKVFCSTSNRTRETAKSFLDNFIGDVVFTDLIMEQKMGALEGKSGSDWRFAFEKSGLSVDDFRPKDGENRADALSRVLEFFNLIKSAETGKNLAIFSHSGFISDLCCNLFRAPFDQKSNYRISSGSLHIIELDKNWNPISSILNLSQSDC